MLVDPLSPDVLVWLVNEWGTVPRAAAGEEQAPYPDTDLLAALLAGSGVRSCPPAALTDGALRQVADRLHRVFAAADLGERVDLVTGLLTETAVTPTLNLAASRPGDPSSGRPDGQVADRPDDYSGGRPGATWRVADARQALLAAAALTLRHQLADHAPDRVGVCSGRRCADAYIDTSPAGQRRFCSVTCQNRARIATWRQRQSQSHQDPSRPAQSHQAQSHQDQSHQGPSHLRSYPAGR